MIDSFIPRLTTTDWGEEWKQLQKARRAADDPAHWDERAKTYGCADPASLYVRKFLEFAQIKPDETVLDMGCGTGAIALPLAAAGCNVIAADFSRGMLDVLESTARERGIAHDAVKTELMSWEDDWEAHGIGERSVDVAVSSRSIATADLRDSLERLTRVARRRACITLAAGSSPRTDERILSAIGLQNRLGRDFLYAFMILCDMGYHPEVRYIPSKRADSYDSTEEAFVNLQKMVRDAAGEMTSEAEVTAALHNLERWISSNLVENPAAGTTDEDGNVQKRFKLREARTVTWAFIAWDK